MSKIYYKLNLTKYLFQESEKHRQQNTAESREMIPLYRLTLKQQRHDHRKDHQRQSLLNDLQLHQRIRTAINLRTDTVSRNHERVLQQSQTPRKQDHQIERPILDLRIHLLQFQIAIPSKGHKNV